MSHGLSGSETSPPVFEPLTGSPPTPAGPSAPHPPVPPGKGGSVGEVVNLAGPAVLSMLSVTLMWTSDTFFVGRLGTAEQGAVGFAGAVAWTFCSLVAGVMSAVQIF